MIKYKNIKKNKKKNLTLEGKLLIATPALVGSCFEKSVVYICAHNENGAMGILTNHTIENLKYVDIFNQLEINNPEINYGNMPVYFGGPTESAKGFILHTSEYRCESTQETSANIALTSTVEILKDIANGKGPKKTILALGCAGWSGGQLEREIAENSWVVIPANEEIIFNLDNANKWQYSLSVFGINELNFPNTVGQA